MLVAAPNLFWRMKTMRMGCRRLREFVKLMLMMLIARATPAAGQRKPNCQDRCGNLSVPYPFGTEKGCYMDKTFYIGCVNTTDPPKALLQDSSIEVLDINILHGQLRILNWVGYDCYNSTGFRSNFNTWLKSGLYYISNTRNKFTAIGCDTYALIQGSLGQNYATGCISICNKDSDIINGSCSGLGCCEAAIPRGVRDYNITLQSYNNYEYSNLLNDSPCSYAFVVEEGAYEFSTADVGRRMMENKLPMILDWTIGNQNCNEARRDAENFACKENSICYEPEFGNGYLCKCHDGFEGNPYLMNGCQDKDECQTSKPCNTTCRNTIGSFNCSCPEGYEGDGLINGTGCTPKVNHQNGRTPIIHIVIGMSVGFLALFLCISWSFLIIRERQIAQLKEKYFKQNGGNLLQQQLSQREGCGEQVKVFAAEELEKATNHYHDSRIIGQGGQGTVYKGILPDKRMVAIKKSRIGDKSQVEPFINEINVLYQINHRNVVKLLGCCLETPVPLLVYEYVTNGTIFDHMHNVGATAASFLPWETRLRIATETAEALSYLHSYASVPIIHRDIKLANILLDEKYTAKVSDFGASRLIPSDQTQVTTIVQGTFGYLDPEYMHTGQLTEKSDVYSFGVVLIELLTGQKVVSFERSEEKKVLAKYFVSLMKEDRLVEILDKRIVNDGNVEHLKEVATLGWRCVRVKGEERPSMKEVAYELAGLQALYRHPWGKSDLPTEETEYLLGELCNNYINDGASSSVMGYDSMNSQVPFEVEGAR